MIVGNGINGFRMGGGDSESLHVPTAEVGKAGHHVKGIGGRIFTCWLVLGKKFTKEVQAKTSVCWLAMMVFSCLVREKEALRIPVKPERMKICL